MLIQKIKKRIIITGFIVAAIHLVLALGTIAISYSSAMERFDNPDYEITEVERVIDFAAKVLMQPCMSLWTSWMSKNMPDVVEWMFFISNSLLWGFAIAFLINVRAIVKRGRYA